MVDRYKNTSINTRSKTRTYSTTIYPKIDKSDTDMYIQTLPGDRLDLLAHRYYGDTSLWWVIAQANTELGIGKGTFFVSGGLLIRIPQDLGTILNKTNKV